MHISHNTHSTNYHLISTSSPLPAFPTCTALNCRRPHVVDVHFSLSLSHTHLHAPQVTVYLSPLSAICVVWHATTPAIFNRTLDTMLQRASNTEHGTDGNDDVAAGLAQWPFFYLIMAASAPAAAAAAKGVPDTNNPAGGDSSSLLQAHIEKGVNTGCQVGVDFGILCFEALCVHYNTKERVELVQSFNGLLCSPQTCKQTHTHKNIHIKNIALPPAGPLANPQLKMLLSSPRTWRWPH